MAGIVWVIRLDCAWGWVFFEIFGVGLAGLGGVKVRLFDQNHWVHAVCFRGDLGLNH